MYGMYPSCKMAVDMHTGLLQLVVAAGLQSIFSPIVGEILYTNSLFLHLLTKSWKQTPELTLVPLTTPFTFGLEYHISHRCWILQRTSLLSALPKTSGCWHC